MGGKGRSRRRRIERRLEGEVELMSEVVEIVFLVGRREEGENERGG